MASDPLSKNLLLAGCVDGSVMLFDRRLSPTECKVLTYREHAGRILKVHLVPSGDKVISASSTGDIKYWTTAQAESVKTVTLASPLTTMDVHPHAGILAVGSSQQFIGVLSQTGGVLSTIKYHEGFMGHRIGPVSCMAFHPYKVRDIIMQPII